VRYVLEGSIQSSGDRVRVTAQMIDAATDAHLWSERYERPLDDIFNLQNEVTQRIAAALGGINGTLIMADAASARRKPPGNLQAYDYYLLGMELLVRQTREEVAKAQELFKKAVELDPQFARAYFGLGYAYQIQGNTGAGADGPAASFEKSKTALLKAVTLDPNDSFAFAILGNTYLCLSDYDHGFAAFQQALVANPNDPGTLAMYGEWLFAVGRAPEGVELVNRAYRLNPRYPDWYDDAVDPFYATGQYDHVITMARRKRGEAYLWTQIVLTLSYAQLGRRTELAATVTELLRRFPDFSFERAVSELGGPIKHEPTLALYLDGARKAGLNECATESELQKYSKMTHLAVCDARRSTN
jgi:tetratricopeptide (TPR) repeat protein